MLYIQFRIQGFFAVRLRFQVPSRPHAILNALSDCLVKMRIHALKLAEGWKRFLFIIVVNLSMWRICTSHWVPSRVFLCWVCASLSRPRAPVAYFGFVAVLYPLPFSFPFVCSPCLSPRCPIVGAVPFPPLSPHSSMSLNFIETENLESTISTKGVRIG